MRLLLTSVIAASLAAAALLAFDRPLPVAQAVSGPSTGVRKEDLVHALSRSPFRSDLWLRLAAMETGDDAERALSLAYLVGGEKAEDLPVRLRLAVLSGAYRSEALRDMVKADISLILLRAPTLRPTLGQIDAKLDPDRRRDFEALLQSIDPTAVAP